MDTQVVLFGIESPSRRGADSTSDMHTLVRTAGRDVEVLPARLYALTPRKIAKCPNNTYVTSITEAGYADVELGDLPPVS